MIEARNLRMKMLRQYLEEDENDHFSRYALALETLEEDPAATVKILVDLLARNPAFLAAYYQLGKAYEKTDYKELALVAYRQGIAVARQQQDLKTENELKTAAFTLSDED